MRTTSREIAPGRKHDGLGPGPEPLVNVNLERGGGDGNVTSHHLE